MRLKSSLSIRVVLLLVLLALGTLVVGYYINIRDLEQALLKRETDKSVHIQFVINSLLEEEIKRLVGFSKLLAEDREFIFNLERHGRSKRGSLQPLRDLVDRECLHLGFDVLEVMDAKGVPAYNSRLSMHAREGYRYIWGIEEALEGKRVLAAGKWPSGPALWAIEPVYGSNRLIGIVLVGTLISDRFAQKIAKATNTEISFSDINGVMVSSLPAEKRGLIHFDTIRDTLVARHPCFREDPANRQIIMYVPLMIADETFCLVVITDGGAMEDQLAESKRRLVHAGLAIFTSTLLLGTLSTIYFVRPLAKLKHEAIRIAGRFSGGEGASFVGGNEIETLTQAFHLMVEKMNRHVSERDQAVEDLKRAQNGLEERILERTKELVETNAALNSANRAKSEFLTNMSHELRTPLNAIIGFTELVLDRRCGDLTEMQADYLSDVLQSSRHLLSLINDILDLSKVEAGKMELELGEVHLKGLLEGSLVMVREKALKHGIRLGVEMDGIPERIWADERKLKQVMFNLLSNAVKFTPDGGKIGLRADLVRKKEGRWWVGNEEEGAVPIPSEMEGGGEGEWVRISVEDTGIGLKKEDLGRIFDPFEQVDSSMSRRYQGTGLGLALTRQMVELHGGRIWAESEGEGKGSVFYVVLPVSTMT